MNYFEQIKRDGNLLARPTPRTKEKKRLKRSTKPIPKIRPARRRQREQYSALRKEYLAAHPICQLMIAVYRFDEKAVLAALGEGFAGAGLFFRGQYLPAATQIHHRNKCAGVRLNDVRWFASTSEEMHRQVEENKDWARKEGFLLPIEADVDGRLPDGARCQTTDDWLAARAK